MRVRPSNSEPLSTLTPARQVCAEGIGSCHTPCGLAMSAEGSAFGMNFPPGVSGHSSQKLRTTKVSCSRTIRPRARFSSYGIKYRAKLSLQRIIGVLTPRFLAWTLGEHFELRVENPSLPLCRRVYLNSPTFAGVFGRLGHQPFEHCKCSYNLLTSSRS